MFVGTDLYKKRILRSVLFRIRELTSVVQKRFNFPENTVDLYAEKVATRGLCAIAQVNEDFTLTDLSCLLFINGLFNVNRIKLYLLFGPSSVANVLNDKSNRGKRLRATLS